jgi:hypothetical protein
MVVSSYHSLHERQIGAGMDESVPLAREKGTNRPLTHQSIFREAGEKSAGTKSDGPETASYLMVNSCSGISG